MKLIYANFDQESLDREYSPSSCIDDINVYLDLYTRESDAAKRAALALYKEDNGCYLQPVDLHLGNLLFS